MTFRKSARDLFIVGNAVIGCMSISFGSIGLLLEDNKNKNYAYSQAEISKFSQHMLYLDRCIRTTTAYIIGVPLFVYGFPFHRKKYISVVYSLPKGFILDDRWETKPPLISKPDIQTEFNKEIREMWQDYWNNSPVESKSDSSNKI